MIFVLDRGGGGCSRDICVSSGMGGGGRGTFVLVRGGGEVFKGYLNICVSPGVFEGYLCYSGGVVFKGYLLFMLVLVWGVTSFVSYIYTKPRVCIQI